MATSKTSLVTTFLDSAGNAQSFTWANIDPETPSSAIRAFVQGVVTHSSAILKDALTACTEAILRTTTDNVIDLSE